MSESPEQRIIAAIRSWPNHPWMVLPGPTDLAGSLAAHLVKELGITQEWGLRGHDSANVHWKSADRDEPRSREDEFPFSELVERDVMPWQPDRHRNRTT